MTGDTGEGRFRTRRGVEFHHCDPAGIVFYPRYFEMLNSVVEEWFGERNGLPFDRMHRIERRGVPTVRLETVFTAPSRQALRNSASLNIALTRSWQSSNVPSTAMLWTLSAATVVI